WTNVLGQCEIDHLNCPDLHECFVELAYVWKSDETPPVFRWRVRAGLRPVGAIDPACSGFIGVVYESADKRLDECQQLPVTLTKVSEDWTYHSTTGTQTACSGTAPETITLEP